MPKTVWGMPAHSPSRANKLRPTGPAGSTDMTLRLSGVPRVQSTYLQLPVRLIAACIVFTTFLFALRDTQKPTRQTACKRRLGPLVLVAFSEADSMLARHLVESGTGFRTMSLFAGSSGFSYTDERVIAVSDTSPCERFGCWDIWEPSADLLTLSDNCCDYCNFAKTTSRRSKNTPVNRTSVFIYLSRDPFSSILNVYNALKQQHFTPALESSNEAEDASKFTLFFRQQMTLWTAHFDFYSKANMHVLNVDALHSDPVPELEKLFVLLKDQSPGIQIDPAMAAVRSARENKELFQRGGLETLHSFQRFDQTLSRSGASLREWACTGYLARRWNANLWGPCLKSTFLPALRTWGPIYSSFSCTDDLNECQRAENGLPCPYSYSANTDICAFRNVCAGPADKKVTLYLHGSDRKPPEAVNSVNVRVLSTPPPKVIARSLLLLDVGCKSPKVLCEFLRVAGAYHALQVFGWDALRPIVVSSQLMLETFTSILPYRLTYAPMQEGCYSRVIVHSQRLVPSRHFRHAVIQHMGLDVVAPLPFTIVFFLPTTKRLNFTTNIYFVSEQVSQKHRNWDVQCVEHDELSLGERIKAVINANVVV